MTTHAADQTTVLEDVQNYISEFVAFSDEASPLVLSAYVLHTWAFETARRTPYLYIHSPEPQSGKSTLLEVLDSVVCNGIRAAGLTAPVLFRLIGQSEVAPTVMIDEVDTLWSGSRNEAMRGVINGGYKEGGSIYRLERGVATPFSTFCPKVMAGIHNGCLPETILQRSIPITMRRKKPGTVVRSFYGDLQNNEALFEKIDNWLAANHEELRSYPLVSVEGLSDRESELLWPLLSIAATFGLEDEMVEAFSGLIGEYKENVGETDVNVRRLHSLAEMFANSSSKIHTQTLKDTLEMTDKDYLVFVDYLSQFKISPANVRIGAKVAKGYTRQQFDQLFDSHNILSAL